jgi:NADH-quinone oxidoreductase subunit G
MALVLIDGKEIVVNQNETLLKAALRENIYIPYYCYHPALSIVGQCRMCLVKVEGAPKLLTACTTYVSELPKEKKIDGKYDMKVFTKTEEVKEAQRGILEFLLLNHPLDCPICDQAGECQLQIYSYEYGKPRSEFRFEKLHAPKRVDLGEHIVYDAERCIKCTRCIRFCNEITKTGELTLVERGVHTYVDVFEGKKLNNPYSICTVDICPVGALTFKEFRFKERVWFLQATNSVCPECSRNCSIRVDTYKGEIMRIVPRFNPYVNNHFICDYGRLITERIKNNELREMPSVKEKDILKPIIEKEFYEMLLSKITRKYKLKDVLVILSGRMTNEEVEAYKVLSLLLFGEVLGESLYITGDKDEILIKEEKRPNYFGEKLLDVKFTKENENVLSLIKDKKLVISIREDIFKGMNEDQIRKAQSSLDAFVVMDAFFTETAKMSDFYIPLANWFEMEGTTFNFDGHLQKISKCVSPPKGRKPFYDVVSTIMNILTEMETKDFETDKEKEIESVKKVLESFKNRDVMKGGFLTWFKEVKNAIPQIKNVSLKDIVPLGFSIKGNKDGNS